MSDKEGAESSVCRSLEAVPVVRLDVGILGDGMEARALLDVFPWFDDSVFVEVGAEVTMSHYFGLGELGAEANEERTEGALLGLGSGVGWATMGVQAAFVGYAYGGEVVAFGVCAWCFDGAHVVGYSVGGDVVVIAALGEASFTVGAFEC